ncbi:MAG TPA: protein kinase [Solirubrobacteraceae bacterium]|jgi:serine/threonine-protein kinase|nr:protein kinase [Solirubrobacteraceae bacterium]
MTGTTTIAGRYRIEGRLGVGGMSTVHLAFDSRLERYVALKLLAEHLADDPTFVSRFRREALAAARLVHPNIVQVFDFGFDSGHHQHFIVMEHVSGNSCAELLRDRGRLPLAQAIDIVSQACRGLDYAHRNGVVHRDVKPGNLLVSDSDVVKLADFGIARAVDQSSITQAGSVLGTAAYLAPEQARGEEAGPQADLYSLGVVSYQLISGRLPYEASSLSELALKQQRESPIPLDELNPEVPAALAAAVATALAIDQRARPHDAMELAEALQDGARGIGPTGAPAGFATGATRVAPRDSTDATRVTPRRAEAPPTAARAVPPRQVPPRRQIQPEAAYARRPDAPDRELERSSRGFRRMMALFALLAVLALIVVAAVAISNSMSNTAVHYQKVVARDAQSAISQVQNLINQYTK